jgi:hypothetical protein
MPLELIVKGFHNASATSLKSKQKWECYKALAAIWLGKLPSFDLARDTSFDR